MNKIIRTLLGMFALGAITTALQAQPAIKLVTVDMMSLFDKHYKTEEANAKFNDAAQKAQEQLDELNKKIQSVADEYKELMEQSKNAMLTPDAQKQKGEEAQKKIEEFQRMQAEAQNFRANTQRSLQQRVKTHRDLLLEEISKIVTDVAKRKGATLVLDRSGPNLLGVSTVIFSDPAYDITEEVAKEINKDRPPAAPAAAPTTAAPATATPAPQFTVPNVSPKPADPKKP
jgi:outer membrane protein